MISPGAVETELTDSVTGPDVAESMRKVYEVAIPVDSFAKAVAFAMSQPERPLRIALWAEPYRQLVAQLACEGCERSISGMVSFQECA